jgi:hypothetical protein
MKTTQRQRGGLRWLFQTVLEKWNEILIGNWGSGGAESQRVL